MKSIILSLLLLIPTMAFSKTITLSAKNSVTFNTQFDDMSVAKKSVELMNLVKNSKEKDFYLVMNTPGGSVSDGQNFIDFVRGLGKNVHTITIFSASMGYQTVQALGKRYILPSGILMSHRGRISGLGGQIPGELNTRVKMLENMLGRMDKAASSRVGISLESYQNLVRDEYWVTGEDAVRANHADEVVLAKCDDSLSGTYTETVYTLFGPVNVELSNCPLITGILGISAGNSQAYEATLKYFNNLNKDIKQPE